MTMPNSRMLTLIATMRTHDATGQFWLSPSLLGPNSQALSERQFRRLRLTSHTSDHDARITQVLIAIDQVDLAHLDFPFAGTFGKAMAAPARQETHAVRTEFADQEIRAHHAFACACRRKHLHIGDHPHRARLRRLRPGVAGAQP